MANKASAGFSKPKQEQAKEVKFSAESFDVGEKKLVLSYNKQVERFDLRLDDDLIVSSCLLADVRPKFEEMKASSAARTDSKPQGTGN